MGTRLKGTTIAIGAMAFKLPRLSARPSSAAKCLAQVTGTPRVYLTNATRASAGISTSPILQTKRDDTSKQPSMRKRSSSECM
jgi:hypothetical protein